MICDVHEQESKVQIGLSEVMFILRMCLYCHKVLDCIRKSQSLPHSLAHVGIALVQKSKKKMH